ncbi:hypothetical protein [Jannaschia sp. M317]|uniref:hypothetical protein n=1 Tax=Jannaschia sp. M317 TaxID=2867011 RepID=UPI0021A3020F|nr:hypothetical protein [Jannaschia sp. M317]UWQ16395.1 hypothetical protein K3551_10715 [Jannaschia sp. M317]
MTLIRIGGVAALICAATYLVGFVLLMTLLAPLGYGTTDIDASAVLGFNAVRPGVLTAWNSTIYVLNALALIVLVVALSEWLASQTPGWASVTREIGLVWAALVLGAGMIANVALVRAAHLHAADPAAAEVLWTTLHAVELGLGGGNEIAGAVWIGCVSLAGRVGESLGRLVIYLGLLTGLGGLLTVVPAFGDAAGAVFGLGAIAWFLAIGFQLFGARESKGI